MGNHGPGVSCCGILTSLFGITEMNERIKELAEQCTSWSEGSTWTSREVFDKEKFAELIVGECIRKINDIAESSNNPQPIYRVAVDLLEHFGVEE
jgi:hypothetical protein